MAKIGLRYPVAAPLTENETETSYTGGKVIGKAINSDININSNDVKLYADDVIAESDKSFKDGNVKIGVDDLDYETQAMLLGHKVSEEGELVANADDTAPFVGFGFYGPTKKNNVLGFRAIFLHKVQFAEPAESITTKGETVSFQTPVLEGTIYTDVKGDWKSEKTFPTEAEAKTWLETKAGIKKSESGTPEQGTT